MCKYNQEYQPDNTTFYLVSGISPESAQGKYLRRVARDSLLALYRKSIQEACFSNEQLAHAIKGICAQVGAENLYRLTNKLQLYSVFLARRKCRLILNDVIFKLVDELH